MCNVFLYAESEQHAIRPKKQIKRLDMPVEDGTENNNL